MDDSKIPEQVKLFIYNYIESVEILEILLFLRINTDKWSSAEQINLELKTQTSSIAKRLAILKSYRLVEEHTTDQGHFIYSPSNAEIKSTVDLLAEEYKIRRYRIYELIFSQKNNIKNFADAFKITSNKTKKDDENG